MKKSLIFVLFALVSIVSYSQIAWSVKAGMTMNNMTKLEDSKMKLGYTVGVGVDYAINDMWAIQSGLNITAKGTKSEYDDSDEDGKYVETTKYNPTYLEIPILAAVKFQIADNMKFTVNAGPYLAFGLGGKSKDSYDLSGEYAEDAKEYPEDYSENSWKLFKKEKGEEKAALKRFDLGLQYGIGLEISEHYLVSLSGQYGFINPINEKGRLGDALYKYDKDTGKKGDKISPKNMSFAISVGYKF